MICLTITKTWSLGIDLDERIRNSSEKNKYVRKGILFQTSVSCFRGQKALAIPRQMQRTCLCNFLKCKPFYMILITPITATFLCCPCFFPFSVSIAVSFLRTETLGASRSFGGSDILYQLTLLPLYQFYNCAQKLHKMELDNLEPKYHSKT